MRRLISKRLWQGVLVLFVVSVLSFLLVYVSGDPVRRWCRLMMPVGETLRNDISIRLFWPF